MRIGIDARVMSLKASGIGRYTIEMVKSMAARSNARDHEFILYPGKDTLILDLPGNWTYSERKITSRGISRSLLYSYIARKDHLDAFYSADYLGPVLPMPCKTVITVHDLIPVVYPSVTQFRHRFVGKYLLPQCMRNASVIISVSHATQKDILKYTNVPKNKIRVIYEGKNPSFHPRGQDDGAIRDIREYYKIGEKPYLLFLGTLEPKKNLFNIVKAFARLDDTTKNNSLLVLGGNAGWDNSVLETLIEELGLDGKVVLTGFVNDEHLPLLMSGAQAFCFPSLYEGFGLPVLEAMACGCPVITSNISSLPEVAGDAALLVDPQDVEQISQAMAKLLTDNKLCEELRFKAVSQAEKFCWDKAAGEVLEILTTK